MELLKALEVCLKILFKEHLGQPQVYLVHYQKDFLFFQLTKDIWKEEKRRRLEMLLKISLMGLGWE